MSSRIAEQRIAAYLRAKDENRPHLMAEAFAPEVGCGRCEWRFQREAPRLVEGLRITIASMQVLVPEAHDAVFAWVARLPRPWCSAEEALACWPAEPLLAPVRDFVSDAASPREAVPA